MAKTLLYEAAQTGSVLIVKELLKAGIKIDAVDENGRTALHEAIESTDRSHTCQSCLAKRGNLPIVKALIKCGANVNIADNDGTTTLITATICDNIPIVKVLLKYGANTDVADKWGKTAIFYAAADGNCLKVLLQHGADIDVVDIYNVTALCYASYRGKIGCVKALLEYGANMNIDKTYADPIHLASTAGLESTAAEMLKEHIVKLKSAGLFVSKQMYDIEMDDYLNDLCIACEKEVGEMKRKKFHDTNVSFYDIVSKDLNALVLYLKNENVLQALKCSISEKFHKNNFPIYYKIITRKFERAEKRESLLRSSLYCFKILYGRNKLLTGLVLPDSFIEEMLLHLNNRDLKNIVKACSCLY